MANIQVIAERLQNPEYILTVVEKAKKQSRLFHWGGALFSNSFASVAQFYLYLTRCLSEQAWEEHAHKYLRLAAQSTHHYPLEKLGLFDGSSGFALILSAFSEHEPRYHETYNEVQEEIARQVLARRWKRRYSSVEASDYDVMSGVSGIVGYLTSLRSPSIHVEEAILKLLGYLIWLSDEDQPGRKNWFIAPEHLPLERYREEYPDGYLNVGLSHGIAGPLAALALAWKAGYRIPGQREAIERLSQWIVERQVQDEWGINWPTAIPLQMSHSPEQWRMLPSARAAWCYGAPGIASTLWLAGAALQDTSLHQIALQALETVLQRPIEQRNINSPTICHGVAGLLAICLRFAHVSQSQIVQKHISLLTEQILGACHSDLPLTVQDQESNGIFVDDPGFLTGAIGVALVLLAVCTSVEPQWNRALLIA
ncbi:MAG: lanthionine synthetase C family protein [Ktedonobacteraceae bacterium]|nr:lanthionine synthetase C family protein [Ktedonobacteraceae bacterium]